MAGYSFPGDITGAGRSAGQVASGIGFLGAGVILKESASVRGFNLAATLWCSSAVGVMAGIGHPLFALSLALGVLTMNIVFRPLAYRLHPGLNSAVGYRVDLKASRYYDEALKLIVMLFARETGVESMRWKAQALCTGSLRKKT